MMDSETQLFSCLALAFFNPLAYWGPALIQTLINFLFLPLSAFGIATPDVSTALGGCFS